MLIENIELKNFKSHQNTKMNFGEGISVIMGENGAGKSSIMEAISFVLFREYTSKKIDKLITNGKNSMVAILDFNVNGQTYRVTRKRVREGRSESKLEIKNDDSYEPYVSGNSVVTEEIQKILEMDKGVFLNAVYVRQGEIAALLEKDPSERKEMIGKLLGIDNLEKAWDKMPSIIKKYADDEIRLKEKLNNLQDIPNQLKTKQNEESQLNIDLKELDKKIKGSKSNIESYSSKKEELDRKEEKYHKLNEIITRYKELLTQVNISQKKVLDQLALIDPKEKEIERIKPLISNLELLKKLKYNISTYNTLNTNETNLKNSISQIESYNEILYENEQKYKDYNSINEEITGLQDKRDKLFSSHIKLNSWKDQCHEISERINQTKERIDEKLLSFNSILKTDFKDLKSLESYLTDKTAELKNRENKRQSEINEINNKVSKLEAKIETLREQESGLTQVEDKCPICQSEISDDKRNELLRSYLSQIEINRNHIEGFNHKKGELESSNELIASELLEIGNINLNLVYREIEKVDDDEKELRRIHKEMENIKQDVTEFEATKNKLNKANDSLLQLKDKYEEYKFAKISLQSLGDYDALSQELKSNQEKSKLLENTIQSQIQQTNVKIEEIDKVIEDLEKLNNRFNRLTGQISNKDQLSNDISEYNKQINDYNQKISKLDEEIVEINYNKKVHEKVNKELKEAEDKLINLNINKTAIETELGSTLKAIEELKTKMAEYKIYEEEHEKLSRYIEFLNRIRELYSKDGIQRDLRESYRDIIEANTAEFFEKFNFEYSDISLDEDYNITVYGPSGKNSIDMISGGEKIAVALGLRLGITQALSEGNLELIMLDEPTIHLDGPRRQELIELLKKLAIIPQMIVVTHDDELEEAASNIIKIKKENGVSLVQDVD
ncbi:AAA family ATPase [Methanobacterium sp. MBAC-LM]|uniref:AAA family ATPase n=1 Tax=Methanobacterium sp. MBAC-LM TaxID=3412034 RepID=UPI003C74C34D